MNQMLHTGSCHRRSGCRRPNKLTVKLTHRVCRAIFLQLSLFAKPCSVASTNHLCALIVLFMVAHLDQFQCPPGAAIHLCPILHGRVRAATHTMQFPISNNNAVFRSWLIHLAVFSAHNLVCTHIQNRRREQRWQGSACQGGRMKMSCLVEGVFVGLNECASVAAGLIECA